MLDLILHLSGICSGYQAVDRQGRSFQIYSSSFVQINYVFHSADCFCRLDCCFLSAVRFVSRETCDFPHCPMCFLYLFHCILVFYHFMFPSSCYLTEMALFSAFCLRRCFLCVVSHETLCILLSRLSYFLFIHILSSFYFLFNRWSGISAFCRSCCLLALFHMKHLAFFSI